ncbi:hypothetical protein, partial [Candidatus Hakubella thermalkaliphila]
RVILLWKEGRRYDPRKLFTERGFGMKDAFYRVAQPISENFSSESRQKKLLDGFLSGKEKIVSELKETITQKDLF